LLNAEIARASHHREEAIREYRAVLTSAAKNHFARTQAWLGLSRLAGSDQTLLPLPQMQAELEFFLQPGQRDYWAGFEASMREAIGNVYLARGQTAAAQEAMKAALAIREQADDTRNGIWYALTMLRLADAIQPEDSVQSAQLRQRADAICRQYPACRWQAPARH
jgi:tetratricopeptide (TPR) repeat protein